MVPKTRTLTTVTHKTTLTSDGAPKKDGGRSLLMDTFDLIHTERQVGELTVQFGPGGSISSVIFTEKEVIPQKSIEFADENGTSPEAYQKLPEKRYLQP